MGGIFLALGILLGCAGPKAPVDTPTAAHHHLLVERGRMLAAQGQGVRAEQVFLAALDAGADGSFVLPMLLEVCIAGGRLQRALDYAYMGLLRGMKSGRLHYLVATLHHALGQPQEARDQASLALADEHPALEAWLLLADLHFRHFHQQDKAKEFYRRFLRVQPRGIEADRARRMLSELSLEDRK